MSSQRLFAVILKYKWLWTEYNLIIQAVFDLDIDALSLNIIQIMIEQIPTPEEQQAVNKHLQECNGDITKLDKAEKYIYEMSKVVSPRCDLLRLSF